jgi:hypothetical protein
MSRKLDTTEGAHLARGGKAGVRPESCLERTVELRQECANSSTAVQSQSADEGQTLAVSAPDISMCVESVKRCPRRERGSLPAR